MAVDGGSDGLDIRARCGCGAGAPAFSGAARYAALLLRTQRSSSRRRSTELRRPGYGTAKIMKHQVRAGAHIDQEPSTSPATVFIEQPIPAPSAGRCWHSEMYCRAHQYRSMGSPPDSVVPDRIEDVLQHGYRRAFQGEKWQTRPRLTRSRATSPGVKSCDCAVPGVIEAPPALLQDPGRKQAAPQRAGGQVQRLASAGNRRSARADSLAEAVRSLPKVAENGSTGRFRGWRWRYDRSPDCFGASARHLIARTITRGRQTPTGPPRDGSQFRRLAPPATVFLRSRLGHHGEGAANLGEIAWRQDQRGGILGYTAGPRSAPRRSRRK